MTGPDGHSGAGDGQAADRGADGRDISQADAQALTALFAGLVDDAEPSSLTPLAVQRLAKADHQGRLDRKIKRFKFLRNALVAAVLAGAVALVLPHLGGSTASTASSAVSAAAPAARAAGTPPVAAGAATSAAAGSAASGAVGGSASDAASGSAASAAAGSSAGAAGSSNAAAGPPAGAAGSPAGAAAGSSNAAAGSSAAASGALPTQAAGGGAAALGPSGSCVPVSAAAVAAVRASLPAQYRNVVAVSDCGTVQARKSASDPGIRLDLTRAPAGVCAQGPDPVCVAVPGSPGAFEDPSSALPAVVVYDRNLSVTARAIAVGPTGQQLIAAARALLDAVS